MLVSRGSPKKKKNAILVRGAAGSIAVIVFTASAPTAAWLNLKLDAQYVICPGGYTAPTNRNAFVLGVRTTVDFC